MCLLKDGGQILVDTLKPDTNRIHGPVDQQNQLTFDIRRRILRTT